MRWKFIWPQMEIRKHKHPSMLTHISVCKIAIVHSQFYTLISLLVSLFFSFALAIECVLHVDLHVSFERFARIYRECGAQLFFVSFYFSVVVVLEPMCRYIISSPFVASTPSLCVCVCTMYTRAFTLYTSVSECCNSNERLQSFFFHLFIFYLLSIFTFSVASTRLFKLFSHRSFGIKFINILLVSCHRKICHFIHYIRSRW